MEVQHKQQSQGSLSLFVKRVACKNLMAVILFFAFAAFLVLQLIHQATPPTELHAFRQTQTALSIREIVRGGPLLHYETPVLGPPWSIPFEFPLYQWIVAAIVGLFGTPLVTTARLVSSAMFLVALLAANSVLKRLGAGIEQRRVFVVLTLLSPIYLYWSRTVMIESTALALTLGFTAVVLASGWSPAKQQTATRDVTCIQTSTSARVSLTGLALLLGILAALVKPTTFAGAAILLSVLKVVRRERWIELLRVGLLIGASGLSAQAWAAYGDAQKMHNPLAPFITSTNLMAWNFGTVAQKLNLSLWLSYLLRTFAESIGGSISLLAVLGFLLIRQNQKNDSPQCLATRTRFVGLGIGGFVFLGVPAVFTNLHFVHQYYPYASVIYLLAGMAYAVAPADGEPWNRHSIVVVSGMLAFAAIASIGFLPSVIGHDNGLDANLLTTIRANTEPSDVVLVRGLDWSSELAYGADRKTIMDISRGVQVPEAIKISLQNVAKLGLHLGAFVSCGQLNSANSTMEINYAHMLNMPNQPTSVGGCRIFSSAKT